MRKTGKIIARFLGWLALIVILLLVTAFVVFWVKAPGYIKKNLSEVVHKNSEGLYQLSYSDVELNMFPVSVAIKNLRLEPDEHIAAKKMAESPEKIVFSFESLSIDFQQINLRDLIREKSFHAKQLEIINPNFEISGNDIFQKNSDQTLKNLFSEISPVFKNYLREIKLDRIVFEDAQYGLTSAIGDSSQISKADNISIDILSFRTDSSLISNPEQLFTSEDIIVRMNDFQNDLGDSLHVMFIDTLQYSLKTSDVRAAGFRLTALENDSTKNMYEVVVPRFFMKSESITNFTFKDSINIQFLEFSEPEIKFFQRQNTKKLKVEELNNFDLYTLIQDDFSSIEIDSFLLSSAMLEIYKQPDLKRYQQRFHSVNIKLNGFDIDSLSAGNTEKLLHADNLEMTVAGYHLRLEDNQHDFRADSLFVSTFSNALGALNIAIDPSQSGNFDSRTELNISGDAIQLSNVSLKELYHTRRLPVSAIEISRPEVSLRYHTERKKTMNQREAGLLFDIVTAYLKGVYSNIVYINDGKLSIENHHNQQLKGYFETNFTFSLTDFSLDSVSVNRSDKFFYATNFDLRFSDYEMKLVDDLHKLNVGSVYFSSLNQQAQITNLHLQPVVQNVTTQTMKSFGRSELYNILVPSIQLQGVNLREAFFHNQLKISDFKISNPEIYFENFNMLRSAENKMEFSELYNLVSSYIFNFNIDKISVPNGKLTWVNHTRKGKTISFDNEFSATLDNFVLNENELNKQRLLFSDNFDISIKDQIFQLSDSVHILRAGEINLSTTNSSIEINNALLYPVITAKNYSQLPTTFQVAIPELRLSNFDFLSAYYSRKLELDELEISQPKIQIYQQPGVFKSLEIKKYNFPLPEVVQSLKLENFKINNGEVITYQTNGLNQRALSTFHVNLELPNLSLINENQKITKLQTDNVLLKLSDFKSPLGESHDIIIGTFDFNREEKNILVSNLSVNPFLPANQGNQFTVSIPEVTFSGFNIAKALEENNFSFDEIIFQHPNIKIEVNDSIKEDKIDFLQTLDLYAFTEPFVDRIQVSKLNLLDADINFNWFQKQLIDKKINFTFDDILIAENQPPANLLNSARFEISTTDLRRTDKNNFYEFTADSLVYNSAKHNILVKNININPLVSEEQIPVIKGFQTDVVNAQIDVFEISGLNEKTWLNQNILDAKFLRIGKSNVDIFRNKRYAFNENQQPPWPQDLIDDIKQPFVFDSIILEPSFLKYSELLTISDEPGYIAFNELQFRAGKLSNMDSVKNQIHNFTINATTKLFNRSKLTTKINLDLTSPSYAHTISGNLENMPLTLVNAMVEKSAPVSIESGNLDRFSFDVKLNERKAIGQLYFGYDDLKISLLDYSEDDVRISKFASFWANRMILNSENPKKGELSPSKLNYQRDPQRSIINYWWKTIYSGAKTTIGLETK